ncbi:MAG: hypothetical protein EBW45_05015, partial [Actinobacteria bacterium]|nr:hypothetical protein [Actinomycetota bacterium]
VIQNYDLKPVPYSDIDWVINPDGTSDQEWTPVEVTGTYLPELATVVRNRPLNGQPGFLQLVPLRLPSGELLISKEAGSSHPLSLSPRIQIRCPLPANTASR